MALYSLYTQTSCFSLIHDKGNGVGGQVDVQVATWSQPSCGNLDAHIHTIIILRACEHKLRERNAEIVSCRRNREMRGGGRTEKKRERWLKEAGVELVKFSTIIVNDVYWEGI